MPARYGYRRSETLFRELPPYENICVPCYRRRFTGVGQPTPQARRLLGYDPLSKAQAQGITCAVCGQALGGAP